MGSLTDRPNTALLVVDVQRDVVADVHDRDNVIANIRTLVDRARGADVPVVWVQDFDEGRQIGTEGWQLAPELSRDDPEPRVDKTHGDSFEDTDLEAVLADKGIGHLFVVGAQTDACIRATLHGAFVRGYDVTLVGDAHTTEDLTEWGAPPPEQVIAHTNMYWQWQTAEGRRGRTLETAEVDFDATA